MCSLTADGIGSIGDLGDHSRGWFPAKLWLRGDAHRYVVMLVAFVFLLYAFQKSL